MILSIHKWFALHVRAPKIDFSLSMVKTLTQTAPNNSPPHYNITYISFWFFHRNNLLKSERNYTWMVIGNRCHSGCNVYLFVYINTLRVSTPHGSYLCLPLTAFVSGLNIGVGHIELLSLCKVLLLFVSLHFN